MSEPVLYASLPPSPMMQAVGLSFPDLISYARKAVHLLQAVGDDAVDLLEIGFRMWSAVSNRDLSGVLLAFADGQRSVESIIAAIRAEFGV